LQRDEIADISYNAIEDIAPAHSLEGLRLGGVERDAHLIQPCLDQLAALLLAHQRAVRIEQHINTALLQEPHHLRQLDHHHGLADTVENHPLDFRKLIDDAGEQLPAHVRRRLEL